MGIAELYDHYVGRHIAATSYESVSCGVTADPQTWVILYTRTATQAERDLEPTLRVGFNEATEQDLVDAERAVVSVDDDKVITSILEGVHAFVTANPGWTVRQLKDDVITKLEAKL